MFVSSLVLPIAAMAVDDVAVRLPLRYDSFEPPAIGGNYTDSVFGVSIKRLSDAPNMHNHAVPGQLLFVSTEYPTASPYNSDNSLLILQHQGYFGLYDGEGNYLQDLPFAVNAATEPRWSRTDPNVLYYVSGNALMRLDVAARTSTLVRRFSEYAAIRGRGESDISRDGDHFVFAADELSTPSAPGLANRYVFVYEISTDTKGAVLDTSGHSFNNLYITPANGVLVGWIPTGTARFTGVELFDRNMVFQRQVTRAIGHMHLTRESNGDDVVVWLNSNDPNPITPCQNGVVKVRLANAAQTCLLRLDWSLAAHITAPDGNGWFFVETYDPLDPGPAVPGWKTYTNEILQVRLDGTETRRLLHHRSRQTSNYGYQPRATVSRDGRKLVFTSNYGLQAILGYPAGYTDAYLVAVPNLVPPRINVNDGGVTEGNAGTRNITFTISLSGPSDLPVTVAFATGNASAIAPSDYAAVSTTLTFAPGETSKTVAVSVNGDTVAEGTETFVANLSGATNAVILDGQGVGTIVNDDLALVPVQWTNLVRASVNGTSLVKTGGSANYDAGAVSRQSLLSGDGQVEFVMSETTSYWLAGLGNGDSSQNYTDIEYALHFVPGGTYGVYEAGTLKTAYASYAVGDRFTVGVESGVVKYRRNGVVFYTSSVAPAYPLLVDTSLYTPGVTVNARVLGFTEPPPALSIGDVSVTEGNSGTATAMFTVSLSSASPSAVTVNYGTANGTATSPTDYVPISGTLSYAPGETTRTVVVTVNGDTTTESSETFFVNLSVPVNAVIGDGQGVGTIVNDDLAPLVQWTNLVRASVNGTSLVKTGGSANYDAGAVSRQLLLSGDGQVEFVMSETASYWLAGLGNGDSSQNYPDIEYALHFVPGGTYGVYEAGTLKTGYAPYAVGDRFTVGVESGVVRYRRNGVLFYTSSIAPAYPLLVDTSLYTPGITVTNARVLGFTEPPPVLSIGDASVTEGNSGTATATFTVSLSGASPSAVTVNYGTANGTATSPTDYVPISGTLSYAPGETTKTIVVTVNGDTTTESSETFFVNLSAPVNGVIGDGQGVGTIVNDDLAPLVQWTNLVRASVTGTSLVKTGGSANYDAGAVSRQSLFSGDGQVEFVMTETTSYWLAGLGNGDSSQNYTDIEYALHFVPGGTYGVYEAGTLKTAYTSYGVGDRFTVGVESGVVKYRRNGVVFYTSSVAPAYPLLVDTSLYTPGITVTNARVLGFTEPPPALSIGDVSVTEGNSGTATATFTVSLSAASPSAVTVNYGTANGTATSPTDYAPLSGTLSYAPGETTRTIVVTVNGDTTTESSETFLVNLSAPVNAAIGDGQGVGTIVNDDLAPLVQWTNLVRTSVSGNSLVKTGGSANYDAGAVSRQSLLSGDGQVEFVMTETSSYWLAGLGNGDSSQNYPDIEYGIHFVPGGTYGVYEAGTLKTGYATFAVGDRFTVGVESGVVKYRRNGVLFYTSGITPAYPLLVDTSLYTPGITVTNARVLGFTAPLP